MTCSKARLKHSRAFTSTLGNTRRLATLFYWLLYFTCQWGIWLTASVNSIKATPPPPPPPQKKKKTKTKKIPRLIQCTYFDSSQLLGIFCLSEYCCDRLRVVSSSGNSTFNASSHESFSLAEYGRLHSGLGSGAWCALTQDKNQYLQV